MALKDNIIRSTDLFDVPGEVLAVPAVCIERAAYLGPVNTEASIHPTPPTVAGVFLAAPGHSRYVTVTFHAGFGCWSCEIAHCAQKATQYERAPSLEAAIARFTELTGLPVPEIRVTEYGVGIYDARTGPAGADNPWKLHDGEQIEVFHKVYGWRQFVVVDSPRGQLIDQIVDGAPQRFAFRTSYLTTSEWNSLKRLAPMETGEDPSTQDDTPSPAP